MAKVTDTTRSCSLCGETKNNSEFQQRTYRYKGVLKPSWRSHCKVCRKQDGTARSRAWHIAKRIEDPEYYSNYQESRKRDHYTYRVDVDGKCYFGMSTQHPDDRLSHHYCNSKTGLGRYLHDNCVARDAATFTVLKTYSSREDALAGESVLLRRNITSPDCLNRNKSNY